MKKLFYFLVLLLAIVIITMIYCRIDKIVSIDNIRHDTIRDTIIIYKYVELDFDEDEDWD